MLACPTRQRPGTRTHPRTEPHPSIGRCRKAISQGGPAAPSQCRFYADICEVNFGGCWPLREGDAILGGRPAANGGPVDAAGAGLALARSMHRRSGPNPPKSRRSLGWRPAGARPATRSLTERHRLGRRVLGQVPHKYPVRDSSPHIREPIRVPGTWVLVRFQKKKTLFFLILMHKYPRKYPPEMVIFDLLFYTFSAAKAGPCGKLIGSAR